MVEQRTSRSRGFLTPVIGGIIVIAALIGLIYFRAEVWEFVKFVGRNVGTWMTEWVPAHPGQTFALAIFAVVAFAINWFAHVRGRLRAWIFALVVEIGLWLLFWFGLFIPSLNKLIGLNIEQMPISTVIVSGIVVIALTGVVFWILEAREEWNKYRRRHHVDED